MLYLRWATRSRADLKHIADFWERANPFLAHAVFDAIDARVDWLASGNHLLGTRIEDLGPEYRSSFERHFGYRVYYRLEGTRGNPPDTLAVIAIRHGRQRPLRAQALARYARS